jgi:DNA topoisomerase-1
MHKLEESRPISSYELSPVLWKIKGGLSAGRVQSVSVRLIVERKIFRILMQQVILLLPSLSQGNHLRQSSKKFHSKKKRSGRFLNKMLVQTYKVADLETKPTKKSLTGLTSTLQQEAARKLYLPVGIYIVSATFIMNGLITYMRTIV